MSHENDPRREDRGPSHRHEDSFCWKTPIGTIRVTGPTVVLVVLILGLGYLFYEQGRGNEESHRAIVGAISEMAYILTLTDAERKTLKLTMPSGMRERMLNVERAEARR